MTESTDGSKARPWAIMVSTFDDSCDLWPLFFHYLFKHWPDVPTPIYLVTNYRRYDDPRVVSLCVGKDRSWGETITRSLEQIDAPYVWMLLDDFFLNRSVDTKRVDEVVGQLAAANGVYLETGRQSDEGEPLEDTDLLHIPPSNPQAGINSAIYSRELLLSLAASGNSLWDGNNKLNRMNLDGDPNLYYLRSGVPPLITFVESVKGKFWKPMGMDYLKETGVKTDLWWRPYPPQGQDPFCKTIRSFHKRRMEFRKKRHERRYESGVVPPVIKPLDA